MEKYSSIIIGGGLSGLSAAVELCARGHKVLLLEQHRYCGGRVYSFIDAATGDTVDNGQHLMMGCYHATRRYLRLMGTECLAFLQPTLQINFLHPSQRTINFECPRIPAPLHVFLGLLGFNAISMKNRLEMLTVAKGLLSTSPSKERELDQLSVEEWLIKLGQSNISKKYLWDVLTIGALNNCPRNVSALMLFRVLRTAFLGRRENSSLFIPRVGLSELFVDPAVQFVESHGGEVRMGVSIESLTFEGTRVRSMRTTDGKQLSAKSFISAVPWYSFEKLVATLSPSLRGRLRGGHYSRSTTPDNMSDKNKSPFHASPIITIHLWLDKKVTDIDFAALLDTRIQWLFNKSYIAYEPVSQKAVEQNRKDTKQHLSLVISGAQEFIGLSNERLVKIAIEDLQRVLPRMQEAKVAHSLVIKEKRATFLPSPGLEALRPDTRTEFENFFLAGDWTATGYPATIEGAVMSGQKAAAAAVR
jgi:squalene-associated FAD-dependent desaturase